MPLDVGRLTQTASNFAQPALPYVATTCASAAGYTAGLLLVQVTALSLRVSCGTPVAGPVLGVAGVGLASVLAGQASLRCQERFQAPRGSRPKAVPLRAHDVALDAALGIAIFKLMGGRFRSLLPSDLFKAGACARESLPAPRGAEYASEINKEELKRIFRRDGCHHCGKRKGNIVADHIPPSKLGPRSSRQPSKLPWSKALATLPQQWRLPLGLPAKPKASTATPAAQSTVVRKAARALGMGKDPQRFYPQCRACSNKQASAVKHNRMTLRMHFSGVQPWHFAGPMVGLRYFRPPQQPAGQAVGGAMALPLADDVEQLWTALTDSAKRRLNELGRQGPQR